MRVNYNCYERETERELELENLFYKNCGFCILRPVLKLVLGKLLRIKRKGEGNEGGGVGGRGRERQSRAKCLRIDFYYYYYVCLVACLSTQLNVVVFLQVAHKGICHLLI